MTSPDADLAAFEANRPALLGLAYRMLGDLGRAEDVVQDAWVRWQGRGAAVDVPRAFLLTTVTRLCLNELGSARARREELRDDRLPEPVDLRRAGLDRIDALDRVSMAFLVLLQRLTPAERAALLLHDVFELDHDEIAGLLEKSPAASRQLLSRARSAVAEARRTLSVDRDAHERLVTAFVAAASTGDLAALTTLLADDVALVADAGRAGGRFGRVKELGEPLVGATRVAAFVAAVGPQGGSGLTWTVRDLNGLPSAIVLRQNVPIAVIQVAADGERITGVFIHADPEHVGRVV
jgi:RNA polymerase sigma-70 factor (ECF subfamily)